MATLTATRRNDAIRTLYERLLAAGKLKTAKSRGKPFRAVTVQQ